MGEASKSSPAELPQLRVKNRPFLGKHFPAGPPAQSRLQKCCSEYRHFYLSRPARNTGLLFGLFGQLFWQSRSRKSQSAFEVFFHDIVQRPTHTARNDALGHLFSRYRQATIPFAHTGQLHRPANLFETRLSFLLGHGPATRRENTIKLRAKCRQKGQKHRKHRRLACSPSRAPRLR